MPITLSPEQEQLLAEVVKAGAACSTEDAVDKAVRALHLSATKTLPLHEQVDNLSELLLNSPFAGANLNLERSEDYPRRVELE